MNLLDLIHRQTAPEPWLEGEKIPWNDPQFSQRMLREHLSQEHDAASRRFETIEKHVAWMHHSALDGKPGKILDLGCGPGLYTSRFARLGHECVGIDFSPASIAYASENAQANKLRCTYIQQDLRLADFGGGYDLVTFIFGEFNVFRRAEIKSILEKARQALKPNGRLILEVHPFGVVRSIGEQRPSWYSTESGLFSDRPHLCLKECLWDNQHSVTIERYYIVDGSTGEVTLHSSSMQAYTDEGYRSLLGEAGFANITFYPSLSGDPDETQGNLFVIVCQKQ